MGQGWRRTKQPAPRPSGRQRPVVSSTRPVYSYYASGRTVQSKTAESSRQPAEQPRQTWFGRLRPGKKHRYTVVSVVCSVVVVLSLARLLFVVPHSKVVVMHQNGTRLVVATQYDPADSERYAKAANAAIGRSVLNRIKPTVDTGGVARALQAQFPELESVSVEVPLVGNRPVVYVLAMAPIGLVETADGEYALTKGGVLLSAKTLPKTATIRLRDRASSGTLRGTRHYASSTMEFARVVWFQFTQAGYTVRYVELPQDAPYELDVYLADVPYRVRLNLQEPALEQSGGAVAVLKQLGATKPQQYVDMRVPGRAYYK